MQVILRENIDKLGNEGDIVNVAPGYARNYLIPRGIAMEATKGNLKMWKMEEKGRELKRAKMVQETEKMKDVLSEVSLTISMAAGEEDQLYGSVTTQMIADELLAKGHKIDKEQVVLDEHIKKLGVYDVPVKLDSEITAVIKVWVVKSE